jgi:hypothetical protein
MSQLTGFWLAYTRTLLVIAWLGATLFPTYYAMKYRFWQSEMGMNFFVYGVALWLNLTPGMLFTFFGDYAGRGTVSVVVFHVLVFAIWWRTIIIMKIDWKKGSDPKQLT